MTYSYIVAIFLLNLFFVKLYNDTIVYVLDKLCLKFHINPHCFDAKLTVVTQAADHHIPYVTIGKFHNFDYSFRRIVYRHFYAFNACKHYENYLETVERLQYLK